MAACLIAGLAWAKTFFTPRELLASQFASSKAIGYVRVKPNQAQKRELARRLGARLPKASYAFNVARTGDRVDGYALFDRELGQHEPIDFATFFDAHGTVTRVEVVAYREAYGDGIRSEKFRHQFVGRTSSSGYRVGKDVDAVSGATISSKSTARVVKRAAVLLDELVLSPGH